MTKQVMQIVMLGAALAVCAVAATADPTPAPSVSASANSPASPPVLARGLKSSGRNAGEDVLPFTSNVVTGPFRGIQHCFVCDARVDQPCIVAFFRQPDKTTASFARAFRPVLLQSSEPPLAWFVFLGDSGAAAESELEDQVDLFASRFGLTLFNMTALGDPLGPPGYRIAPDAAVTVLVCRRFEVRFNRSWSPAAWTDKAATAAGAEVVGLLREVSGAAFNTGGPKQRPGPPGKPE